MSKVVILERSKNTQFDADRAWICERFVSKPKSKGDRFEQARPFRAISVCAFETSYVRTSMVSPG